MNTVMPGPYQRQIFLPPTTQSILSIDISGEQACRDT